MTSTSTDRRDGFNTSAAIKVPCRIATTANITLSGYQTIDGVLPTSSDSEVQRRILVKNQTTTTENGVYIMDTGTWARAKDFDGNRDVTTGTLVSVNFGTAQAESVWRLTSTGTITFGTTAITFEGAGSIVGATFTTVATIAALKALSGSSLTDGQVAKVVSYYAAATPDGGGGDFKWDSSSSATDNGGTIIAPDAGGVGRWRRIYSGALNVKWFGAKGDGATDDSTAIQAAITAAGSAGEVLFASGSYQAVALATTAVNQIFYGPGRITKNANGTLLSLSHSGTTIQGVYFSGGTSFTGDNIVSTAGSQTLIDVVSEATPGLAYWGKAGNNKIIGGQFRTTGATASDYDIKFGDGGTTESLYNSIEGATNNQAIGGVLAATADLYMVSGQTYKLTATGGNSAVVLGSRLVGAVSIAGSASRVIGCGIAENVTFEAGSGQCVYICNIQAAGKTVTNNGNANNLIIKEISAGSVNQLQIGGDASLATLEISPSAGSFTFPQNVILKNAKAVSFLDSGGTARNVVGFSSANNLTVSNPHASGDMIVGTSGTGDYRVFTNSVERVKVDETAVAGNTALMLWDVDNGTLERVTVGAADSGGAGYKVLRIPN